MSRRGSARRSGHERPPLGRARRTFTSACARRARATPTSIRSRCSGRRRSTPPEAPRVAPAPSRCRLRPLRYARHGRCGLPGRAARLRLPRRRAPAAGRRSPQRRPVSVGAGSASRGGARAVLRARPCTRARAIAGRAARAALPGLGPAGAGLPVTAPAARASPPPMPARGMAPVPTSAGRSRASGLLLAAALMGRARAARPAPHRAAGSPRPADRPPGALGLRATPGRPCAPPASSIAAKCRTTSPRRSTT